MKLVSKTTENDVKEQWPHIKKTTLKIAENAVGEKKNKRKDEWYNKECQDAIEAIRKARMKAIQRNTRANKKHITDIE